jgi:hypothetical protein
MLPLIENIEKVKTAIANANKKAINPDVFFKEKSFDVLVEACAACNEICGLALVQFEERLYCIPQFSFTQKRNIQKISILFEGLPFSFEIASTLTAQMCIQFKHRLFWEETDFIQLEALLFEKDVEKVIGQCLTIGKRILERSTDFLGAVFGPIESLSEECLRILNRTMLKVSEIVPPFNHLPFEYVFQKLYELIHDYAKRIGYGDISEFLNERFYEPLLSFEKEWKLHLIHGSEKSIDVCRKCEILKPNLKHRTVELGEGYERFFSFRSE